MGRWCHSLLSLVVVVVLAGARIAWWGFKQWVVARVFCAGRFIGLM